MRIRLISGDRPCPTGPFVTDYVGGVCRAIVGALSAPVPTGRIDAVLDGEGVRLAVDGQSVAVEGFAARIVEDTLRGMVRNLKGVDPESSLRIEVEL
jgi:hypothetical protein